MQILVFIPSYINEIKAERLRSEAFQVSELLINDPGNPLDWTPNPTNAMRIGFSDQGYNKTNLLSSTKISAFGSLNCLNLGTYSTIKNKLGLDYDFSLTLKNSTGARMIDCHPSISRFKNLNTTIRRVISYVDYSDGGKIKYGEMVLMMW